MSNRIRVSASDVPLPGTMVLCRRPDKNIPAETAGRVGEVSRTSPTRLTHWVHWENGYTSWHNPNDLEEA